MNTLYIFFSEFWLPLLVVTPFFVLLTFGRRVSLDGNAVFIGPRAFRELSAFSRDEQKCLLHQADRDAFPGWRLIFPVLMYAATFSGAVAIGHTIPKVTTLPHSFWASFGFIMLFVILGGWISGRLEARCIRPFLKMQIERTQHTA